MNRYAIKYVIYANENERRFLKKDTVYREELHNRIVGLLPAFKT